MSKISPAALEEAIRAVDAALLAEECMSSARPPRKRITPKYTSRPVAWHRLIVAAGQVTAQTGDKLNRTWQAIYNDDYLAARSSLQKAITYHHLKVDLATLQRKATQ
jgi:hypothetical protein